MQRAVLLVDDDESSRVVLSVLLEDEGFRVDMAGSVAEARAMLAGEQGYHLVMLDQHLGDGRGTDLLALVRARAPGAKALLISGSVEEGEVDLAGFDAVIGKSTGFPELLAHIRRLLG